MSRILITCALAGAASLANADPALPVTAPRGIDGFVTVDRLPVPDDPILAQGRDIWGGTCEGCHGGNKPTGAPKITATKPWAPRIAKGFEVLIPHAIQGYIGPRYTEMPARGGNDDLSDSQVAAAVAFMVWASGGDALALEFAQTLSPKE